MKTLGLIWSELDAVYPGIVIGRRYFSALPLMSRTVTSSLGQGWVHSFQERLVEMTPSSGLTGVPATRIAHLDWNRPFVDPRFAYTDDGSGVFHGPAEIGSKLEATTTAEWPSAAWRLTWRDGARHYFDDQGRLLARRSPSGLDATRFEYNGPNGSLSKVIDYRGREFLVTSSASGTYLTAIQDPAGHTISYTVDAANNVLTTVSYPARYVVGNWYSGGQPIAAGWDQGTTRTTQIQYRYDSSRLLSSIRNDADEEVYAVHYAAGLPRGRTDQVISSTGATWFFEDLSAGSLRRVTDPRGFQREYTRNAGGRIVEVRQYIASTNPQVPSRAQSGSYSWQYEWDPNAPTGILIKVTEPDGGGTEYTYDGNYQVTRIEKFPNDGSADRLRWEWTSDAQGRIATYQGVEATSRANPAPYTYTYTRTQLPANHPVFPGGTTVVISTPAGNLRPVPSTWTWTYDARDRLVEYIGSSNDDGTTQGEYWRWEYYPYDGTGSGGLLKRYYTKPDLSRWAEFTYDAAGRITLTTTNDGRAYLEEWNAQGQLTRWQGPDRGSQRYTLEFRHDSNGWISKSRYRYYDRGPSGSGTDPYSWIEANHWHDREGRTIRSAFDLSPAEASITEVEYDHDGNVTRFVDADGMISTIQRDERDRPWIVVDGAQTSTAVSTSINYNVDGRIIQTITPFSTTTQTNLVSSYDKFDRLSRYELANSTSVSVTYVDGARLASLSVQGRRNGADVLLERTTNEYLDWHDGATHITREVYDENGGSLLRTVNCYYEYAPSGKPRVIKLGSEVMARFAYDETGNPSRVYDDLGNSEDILYDTATGNVARNTTTHASSGSGRPLVLRRDLAFDAAGRTVQVNYKATGQNDIVEKYEYDSLDNVVRHEDPKGVVTRALYRWDGLMTQHRKGVNEVTNSAVSTENYSYSPDGSMLTATDARGKTVTWVYDALHRVEKEIQADAKYWRYAYNPGGFLTEVETPAGELLNYGYNTRGLPTIRTVRQSNVVVRTDTYQWTLAGHLKRASRVENGQLRFVEFARDAQGKILSENQDGNLVTYARDGLGRVTTLAGPASARSYVYDHFDRIKSIHDGASHLLADYTYYGPGKAIKSVSLAAGAFQDNRVYDGFGRTTQLSRKGPQGSSTRDYAWDVDGTLQSETRQYEGLGDVYRYDALKRLVGFVRNSANPAAELAQPGTVSCLENKVFSLDGDGHRANVATTPWQGTTVNEPYVIQQDRNHYTNVGGVARTHDDDGNTLSIGNRTLAYDCMDKLIEVRDNGVVVATYEYDALDRRIAKTANGVRTRFVNAGSWILEEYVQPVGGSETLEAIHYSASNADDVVMTQRVDRNDVDGDGNTTELVDLYPFRTVNGSVLELTLANQVTVERIRYDAFGQPSFQDGAGVPTTASLTGNRFLFTGREFDAEAGFYHYRARTYDPATGTFLQEDPLGLVDGLNPVAYVAGNPITGVDPFGMASLQESWDNLRDFIAKNANTITDLILDALGPLGAIIDAIAAATGYDIRGWIASGFKKMAELGTWDRICAGASALAAVGGAIAVIAKLDKILDKLKALAGKAGKAAEKALETACPTGCFRAGTLVLMANGALVPIEDVQLGDLVACKAMDGLVSGASLTSECGQSDQDDELLCGEVRLAEKEMAVYLLRSRSWWACQGLERGVIWLDLPEMKIEGQGFIVRTWAFGRQLDLGNQQARPVIARFVTEKAPTLRLHLDVEDEIEVTWQHPFWSLDRTAWVPAIGLIRGESLAGAQGPCAVERIHNPGHSERVFNLEVGGAHTFRVGIAGVLVHNKCPIDVTSGGRTVDEALAAGQRFVGEGAEELAPGVFRSVDGTRQFRMTNADISGKHGKIGPHVHFEKFDAVTGEKTKNIHTPLTDR